MGYKSYHEMLDEAQAEEEQTMSPVTSVGQVFSDMYIRGCAFTYDTGDILMNVEYHGIAVYRDKKSAQDYGNEPMFIVPLGTLSVRDIVSKWKAIRVGKTITPLVVRLEE